MRVRVWRPVEIDVLEQLTWLRANYNDSQLKDI